MPDLVEITPDTLSTALAKGSVVLTEPTRVTPNEEYAYSWRHLIRCVDIEGQASRPGHYITLIKTKDAKTEAEGIIGISIETDRLTHRLNALATQATFCSRHGKIIPIFIGEEKNTYTKEQQLEDIEAALKLPEDHPAHQYAKVYCDRCEQYGTHSIYYPQKSDARKLLEAATLGKMLLDYIDERNLESSNTLKKIEKSVPPNGEFEYVSTYITEIEQSRLHQLLKSEICRSDTPLQILRDTIGQQVCQAIADGWPQKKGLSKALLDIMHKHKTSFRFTVMEVAYGSNQVYMEPSCHSEEQQERKDADIRFFLECQDLLLLYGAYNKIFHVLDELTESLPMIPYYKNNRKLVDLCIHSIPFLLKTIESNQKASRDSLFDLKKLRRLRKRCSYIAWEVRLPRESDDEDKACQASLIHLVANPYFFSSALLPFCQNRAVEILFILHKRKWVNEKQLLEVWSQNYQLLLTKRYSISKSYSISAAPTSCNLSLIALVSIFNPPTCEELLDRVIPAESVRASLVTALRELNDCNRLANNVKLAFQPMKSRVRGEWIEGQLASFQDITRAKLRLLLRLEAYPLLVCKNGKLREARSSALRYEYTSTDKKILQNHLCDVVRSITTVNDVIKFYEKQKQHAFWDNKRNQRIDRWVMDPIKHRLPFFKHQGSGLRNVVTNTCNRRIQELRAQNPSAIFNNPPEGHPLHQQEKGVEKSSQVCPSIQHYLR